MFRKRKKKNIPRERFVVVERIAGLLLQWQRSLADHVNALLSQLKGWQLRLGLGLIFVLACGYSVILILRGVSTKEKPAPALHIDQATLPRHYDKSGVPRGSADQLDLELSAQLRFFKKYMDSLARHDLRQYDRMLQQRPGLMDSVRALEEIYQLK